MELLNSLTLVKVDLRRKAETLAQTQAAQPQLPPSGSASKASCKRRGCGAATPSDTENRPPQKRPLFQSVFQTRTPTRKYIPSAHPEANLTPYSRILRSRQQSPPLTYDLLDASPMLQPRKRVTLRLSDDKQGNPYVKGAHSQNSCRQNIEQSIGTACA